MFDFWRNELTEDEESALLDKAVEAIRKRGLQLPASLLFEMHKPLSYVGSQAAVVFSPFIVPFLGFDGVNDYARLLSKRENVEKLLERLDREGAGAKEDPEG
ncbi:MAG: hypothetical protein U0S12_06025 [Fimbriimonadales bacterium]